MYAFNKTLEKQISQSINRKAFIAVLKISNSVIFNFMSIIYSNTNLRKILYVSLAISFLSKFINYYFSCQPKTHSTASHGLTAITTHSCHLANNRQTIAATNSILYASKNVAAEILQHSKLSKHSKTKYMELYNK